MHGRAHARTTDARPDDAYTREELLVLASLRRSSGRTCVNCAWYRASGRHRGCFPEGRYRKWLSPEEYESGCDKFAAAEGRG